MLRFRSLLKMATETAAKKLKTEGPLIGTHKYAVPSNDVYLNLEYIEHVAALRNMHPAKLTVYIVDTSMPMRLSRSTCSVFSPNITLRLLYGPVTLSN